MDRGLRIGISGALLAIIITLFLASVTPVNLDFIPSFVAAIVVIYLFKSRSTQEGLVAAFTTYIFSQGILGTLSLVSLYLENIPYEVPLDSYIIFSPIINAVTAVIAGYLGVRLVQRLKPASKETPPPTSITPPQEPIPPI